MPVHILVAEGPSVDPSAGGDLLAQADHDPVVVDLQDLADLHTIVDLLAGCLRSGIFSAVDRGLAARNETADRGSVVLEVIAVVALLREFKLNSHHLRSHKD